MQLHAPYLFGSSDPISITTNTSFDPSQRGQAASSFRGRLCKSGHIFDRLTVREESDNIENKEMHTGTMSSTPTPRGAQEQTLGADTDPGSVQETYGPVPVHNVGPSWSPAELPGVRRSSSILSPYGQSPSPSLSNQDMVLVDPNSLSQHSSEIGSSAYALTRK